jgi:hypothetical protein
MNLIRREKGNKEEIMRGEEEEVENKETQNIHTYNDTYP